MVQQLKSNFHLHISLCFFGARIPHEKGNRTETVDVKVHIYGDNNHQKVFDLVNLNISVCKNIHRSRSYIRKREIVRLVLDVMTCQFL